MNDVFFQSVILAYLEKETPSSFNRSRTYDFPIASSDALSLSYGECLYGNANVSFSFYIC